ncbi:hypothetical protein ACF0H5_007133 [Mactra antiquata]
MKFVICLLLACIVASTYAQRIASLLGGSSDSSTCSATTTTTVAENASTYSPGIAYPLDDSLDSIDEILVSTESTLGTTDGTTQATTDLTKEPIKKLENE